MIPRKEEFVIVLDFLPHGKSSEAMKEPVAQVLGEFNFTLLEVVTRPILPIESKQRIYIGKDERKEVDHIKGRIEYNQLTSNAQSNLHDAVHSVILQREADFVAFINRAGPISIRSHMLELLPGIGKKHLDAIMAARSAKPFENFKDFHERVAHVTSIDEVFTQRIIEELKGESKYHLFTKSPKREDEQEERQWR